MRKILTILFSWACVLGGCIQATDNQKAINQYLETSTDPLFVSLGSTCGPATAMRASGLRKAAFPIDWLFSFDGDKIIEMLDTDFKHFTNPKSLSPFVNGLILNTQYRLEFAHDGIWTKANFNQNFQIFQKKYQRRIERFRKLREYHGKIYFVRCAWYLSTHRNFAFSSRGNIEISEEYAKRLYAALQRYFPKVDIYLVIRNNPLKNTTGSSKLLGKILILKDNDYDFHYILQTLSEDPPAPARDRIRSL